MWRPLRTLEGTTGHRRVVELRATAGPEVGSPFATGTGARSSVRVVWSWKKHGDAPESSVKDSNASAVAPPPVGPAGTEPLTVSPPLDALVSPEPPPPPPPPPTPPPFPLSYLPYPWTAHPRWTRPQSPREKETQ
ncbi:unnamed protein product [Closterium sp. NIES-53]